MCKFKIFLNVLNQIHPKAWKEIFFQIASVELARRGNEATSYAAGIPMGILSYNAIFGKTTEEGEKNLVESKWLSPNKEIEIYVGEVV